MNHPRIPNGRYGLPDTTTPTSASALLHTRNKEHEHGREHVHCRCRGSRPSSAVDCGVLAGASLPRAPAPLEVVGTTMWLCGCAHDFGDGSALTAHASPTQLRPPMYFRTCFPSILRILLRVAVVASVAMRANSDPLDRMNTFLVHYVHHVIPLRSSDYGDGDVRMTLPDYVHFSMPHEGTALPGATGAPAAARPRHARRTWQHKVLSAKERAPTPNSTSGGGVERRPPGDDLLGHRERSVSLGGEKFPPFSEAFPSSSFIVPENRKQNRSRHRTETASSAVGSDASFIFTAYTRTCFSHIVLHCSRESSPHRTRVATKLGKRMVHYAESLRCQVLGP